MPLTQCWVYPPLPPASQCARVRGRALGTTAREVRPTWHSVWEAGGAASRDRLTREQQIDEGSVAGEAPTLVMRQCRWSQ